MIIYNEKFQVETGHSHVTVLNVTKQVREIVAKSGVNRASVTKAVKAQNLSFCHYDRCQGSHFVLVHQCPWNDNVKMISSPVCEKSRNSRHQFLPAAVFLDGFFFPLFSLFSGGSFRVFAVGIGSIFLFPEKQIVRLFPEKDLQRTPSESSSQQDRYDDQNQDNDDINRQHFQIHFFLFLSGAVFYAG